MDLERLEQRKHKLLDELSKASGDRQKEINLTAQLEVIDSLIRNKKRSSNCVENSSNKPLRKHCPLLVQ